MYIFPGKPRPRYPRPSPRLKKPGKTETNGYRDPGEALTNTHGLPLVIRYHHSRLGLGIWTDRRQPFYRRTDGRGVRRWPMAKLYIAGWLADEQKKIKSVSRASKLTEGGLPPQLILGWMGGWYVAGLPGMGVG